MRLPNEPEEPFEINLVPMIDVIFSILAFFIISTLFLSQSQSLPVNLPSAKTAEAKQPQQVNLTIKSDGDLFLNRQPIKLNDLNNKVSSLIKPNSESLIIINADRKVEYGKVVKVMDSLRQIPGAKMAMATSNQ